VRWGLKQLQRYAAAATTVALAAMTGVLLVENGQDWRL